MPKAAAFVSKVCGVAGQHDCLSAVLDVMASANDGQPLVVDSEFNGRVTDPNGLLRARIASSAAAVFTVQRGTVVRRFAQRQRGPLGQQYRFPGRPGSGSTLSTKRQAGQAQLPGSPVRQLPMQFPAILGYILMRKGQLFVTLGWNWCSNLPSLNSFNHNTQNLHATISALRPRNSAFHCVRSLPRGPT